MQKSYKDVIRKFNKIQELYCELDNEIANLIRLMFNTDIIVNANLSDIEINKIINGVLGGIKCVEKEDDHSDVLEEDDID